MKLRYIVFLFIVLLCSCARINIQKPEGFAEISTGKEYKAVSPEGMPFGIRIFKNYPEKDLDFWQQALKAHLILEGYQFVADVTPAAAKDGIICFEWGAPYGGADYLYLTAIKVAGKKIYLAEAAGELEIYRKYREVLLTSLESMD